MSVHKRENPFLKINNDTGFGTNTNNVGGRFINRDGSFNTRKEGVPFWTRFSIFHSMLNLPRWKFISIILIFYFSINLFYTLVYLLAGTDQLQGLMATTPWAKFKEVYFFSTETFTTVGYGRINPVGDWANLISAIESMTGFLSFAIATGLIYGRFSKPRAYLVFSDYALVAPYQDKTALMFRFASYKENHMLTNVEVILTIGLQVIENEKSVFKFYSLPLERNRVDSLPMNFTVVHPIDENSPLVGFSFEDMKTADVELYVLIRGFDDVYSNNVLQRTSYVYDEILFNRKFLPMYRESDDGNTTILELQKLNESVEVESPAT
jgi:inward rectifier potassium channel